LVGIGSSVILGYNRIYKYNILENSRNVFYIIFLLFFVIFAGLQFQHVAIFYAVSSGLSVLFLLWFLRAEKLFSFKGFRLSGRIIKDVLSLGKYSFLSGVLSFLLYRLDILIVHYFLGSEGTGIYRTAVVMAELLKYIGRSVQLVIVPKLQEYGKEKSRTVLIFLSKVIFLTLLCGSLLLAFFGEKIIYFVFKESFLPSYIPMLLLFPGIICYGISQVLSGYYVSSGRIKIFVPIAATALVINVVLDFIFIPHYGLIAASLSSTISYMIGLSISIIYFMRLENVSVTEWFPNSEDIRIAKHLLSKILVKYRITNGF